MIEREWKRGMKQSKTEEKEEAVDCTHGLTGIIRKST